MPLPKIKPIIALEGKKAFVEKGWTYDFKYDGYRGLLHIDGEKSWFISKAGNRMKRFEPLARQVASVLGVESAIFDGEIVVTDETGRPMFMELLRAKKSPSYVAFDMLWLNGIDMRALALSERRKILHKVLSRKPKIVSEAFSVRGKGTRFFAELCARDLEGMVAKCLADPYNSRTKWYKIKNQSYSQVAGRSKLFNRSGHQRKKR